MAMCHKPDCVGLCFNVLHVFRFMVFISLVSNCIFDSVLTRNTKYSGSCPDYGEPSLLSLPSEAAVPTMTWWSAVKIFFPT